MSRQAVLTYLSLQPIDDPLRTRLVGQAESLSQEHDWWGGPLTLEADEATDVLGGSTNLLLVSYKNTSGKNVGKSVEVHDDDDAFMAWMDLCTIVDWLCERSDEHGISWSLSYMEESVGAVREGDEDEELALFVAELGSVVGASFDERDEGRALKLDERHSSR